MSEDQAKAAEEVVGAAAEEVPKIPTQPSPALIEWGAPLRLTVVDLLKLKGENPVGEAGKTQLKSTTDPMFINASARPVLLSSSQPVETTYGVTSNPALPSWDVPMFDPAMFAQHQLDLLPMCEVVEDIDGLPLARGPHDDNHDDDDDDDDAQSLSVNVITLDKAPNKEAHETSGQEMREDTSSAGEVKTSDRDSVPHHDVALSTPTENDVGVKPADASRCGSTNGKVDVGASEQTEDESQCETKEIVQRKASTDQPSSVLMRLGVLLSEPPKQRTPVNLSRMTDHPRISEHEDEKDMQARQAEAGKIAHSIMEHSNDRLSILSDTSDSDDSAANEMPDGSRSPRSCSKQLAQDLAAEDHVFVTLPPQISIGDRRKQAAPSCDDSMVPSSQSRRIRIRRTFVRQRSLSDQTLGDTYMNAVKTDLRLLIVNVVSSRDSAHPNPDDLKHRLFRAFLSAKCALEEYDFLLAAASYRSLKNKSLTERQLAARSVPKNQMQVHDEISYVSRHTQVVDLYLTPGAEFEVSVDELERGQVISNIPTARPDLFAKVEEQCLEHLLQQHYKTFYGLSREAKQKFLDGSHSRQCEVEHSTSSLSPLMLLQDDDRAFGRLNYLQSSHRGALDRLEATLSRRVAEKEQKQKRLLSEHRKITKRCLRDLRAAREAQLHTLVKNFRKEHNNLLKELDARIHNEQKKLEATLKEEAKMNTIKVKGMIKERKATLKGYKNAGERTKDELVKLKEDTKIETQLFNELFSQSRSRRLLSAECKCRLEENIRLFRTRARHEIEKVHVDFEAASKIATANLRGMRNEVSILKQILNERLQVRQDHERHKAQLRIEQRQERTAEEKEHLIRILKAHRVAVSEDSIERFGVISATKDQELDRFEDDMLKEMARVHLLQAGELKELILLDRTKMEEECQKEQSEFDRWLKMKVTALRFSQEEKDESRIREHDLSLQTLLQALYDDAAIRMADLRRREVELLDQHMTEDERIQEKIQSPTKRGKMGDQLRQLRQTKGDKIDRFYGNGMGDLNGELEATVREVVDTIEKQRKAAARRSKLLTFSDVRESLVSHSWANFVNEYA